MREDLVRRKERVFQKKGEERDLTQTNRKTNNQQNIAHSQKHFSTEYQCQLVVIAT